jgi:hypothetical protein
MKGIIVASQDRVPNPSVDKTASQKRATVECGHFFVRQVSKQRRGVRKVHGSAQIRFSTLL